MCRCHGGEGSSFVELFSYKIYKINIEGKYLRESQGVATYISSVEVFVTVSVMSVGINDL